MPTLREAHLAAATRLAQEPMLREQASRDAASLLLRVVGLGMVALHAHPERPVSEVELAALEGLIERRLRFEPMQYILGEQEFHGLPFRVTPATLIPRPETELLVEAVLGRMPRGREVRLVDVGTGSGAIAVALAHHLPLARVVAVDLSLEALRIATGNAERNGVARRVSFFASDLLEAVAGPFDAVVSNPPYVPEGDGAALHPEVREYEPAAALFAGEDGLAVYRRLIPQAWAALAPGGLLALEFGYGQASAMRQLLGAWTGVEVLDDLQGIARVALAYKPAYQS